VTSLIVTMALISLSCYMLDMTLVRTVCFAGAIAVMTMTLTGLAVGLGALYPNFKEENPSKIVSGFGGTFCLVLSFLYILGSVVLLAAATPWGRGEIVSPARSLLFLGIFGILSAMLGWLPLHLGLRRIRTFEL
jgi:ABC-2 type transport system permease protein